MAFFAHSDNHELLHPLILALLCFSQGLRKLYVFGGYRRKEDFLNDFFSLHVDTDEVEVISTAQGGLQDGANRADLAMPSVGHTQRATIDCEKNEIYVMTVRGNGFVLSSHFLNVQHCRA